MMEFPDLSTYNTAEKIQCLECKKYYFVINLGHLSKHGMTPEGYKDKYRIPYGYALAGLKFRDTASERAIRNIDNIYKAKSMADNKKKRATRSSGQQ
jgi:predicted transcriptional regulator